MNGKILSCLEQMSPGNSEDKLFSSPYSLLKFGGMPFFTFHFGTQEERKQPRYKFLRNIPQLDGRYWLTFISGSDNY